MVTVGKWLCWIVGTFGALLALLLLFGGEFFSAIESGVISASLFYYGLRLHKGVGFSKNG